MGRLRLVVWQRFGASLNFDILNRKYGFTVLIKRAEKQRGPEESPQMNWVFRRNERLFRPALFGDYRWPELSNGYCHC